MLLRGCAIACALFCLCRVSAAQDNADSPDSPEYWLSRADYDASNLTDPVEKSGVLISIASGYQKVNDYFKATDVAKNAAAVISTISDPSQRFQAQINFVELEDQLGNFVDTRNAIDAAQETLSTITDPNAQQADAKQLEDERVLDRGFPMAMPTLRAIADPSQRARAALDLAEQFGDAGKMHHPGYAAMIRQAEVAAQEVQDATERDRLFALIAEAEARQDDHQAEAMADRITDSAAKVEALTAVAEMYAGEGNAAAAQATVARMAAPAGAAAPEQRAAIWLNVARVRRDLNDKAGAEDAIQFAAKAAELLEPPDRADATAAASRLSADVGDPAGAAELAQAAVDPANQIVDPSDACEVFMALAAAQARCGMGGDAKQSVATAERNGKNIPAARRHPDGDPTPQEYLDVIQAAATAADFTTAQAMADALGDPHVRHDAVLEIATAEVDASQYQKAEDAVHAEGSADAEAAVCGIVAGSIARTRSPEDAERWIARLSSASDKVAARLAVAQAVVGKK